MLELKCESLTSWGLAFSFIFIVCIKMTLFISCGLTIVVHRKAFLSLLLSAALLPFLAIHGKGPTKLQQASNPTIYEFTCLFSHLILFLNTNPANKQISYLRP